MRRIDCPGFMSYLLQISLTICQHCIKFCGAYTGNLRHMRTISGQLWIIGITMLERQTFQNKDLALKVSPNYDPKKFDPNKEKKIG